MLTTNTNFDAKHDVDYKIPMYLIEFDGESIGYCNHLPVGVTGKILLEDDSAFLLEDSGYTLVEGYPAGGGSESFKKYLKGISGLSQKVIPEEGKASIGGITFELLDYDDEITALLATDSYYFHRKKTVKAGYMGMAEADMLTIMVGWVTGLKLNKDTLSYIFQITDPIKWMQRKIFRGAEDSDVTISGNPLNILLALLTSGSGSGDYDWYDSANGLGLDPDYINVTEIEKVRDDWYPGDSHYMKFTIDERIKAKDFFEKEIFKPLNLYPIIDGQGRFSVKPFKPPLAALETVQSFNADNIIGLPGWDSNLASLINEVEIKYDHDGDDFLTEAFYVDSTSLNNRGPGKKPLTIKTKGLHTSHSPASIAGRADDILETRKNRVFGRFATPPIKLSLSTFFSRWLSEAGDVVPFTHSKIPDITAGTRGLTATRMEIINKTVDWKRGRVRVDLLDTGFAKGIYGVISPTMTIVSASDGENFVVSAADAAKYANLTTPEIQLCDSKMRQRKANVTLLTVNTTTGACTCDDMGLTPNAGDIALFADYNYCTVEQRKWGFIAEDDTGTLILTDIVGTPQDDEIIYESALGSELLDEENLENYTGTQDDGTSDAFTGWSVVNVNDGNGDKVEATATVNSGSNAVKITNTQGLGGDPELRSGIGDVAVTAESFCRFAFYTRGDGTYDGRFGIYDRTNGSWIAPKPSTGVSGVNYTLVELYYQIPVGCTAIDVHCHSHNSNNGAVVYYDDISVKQITNAALANGVLVGDNLKYDSLTGSFSAGRTITGATSGFTATITKNISAYLIAP